MERPTQVPRSLQENCGAVHVLLLWLDGDAGVIAGNFLDLDSHVGRIRVGGEIFLRAGNDCGFLRAGKGGHRQQRRESEQDDNGKARGRDLHIHSRISFFGSRFQFPSRWQPIRLPGNALSAGGTQDKSPERSEASSGFPRSKSSESRQGRRMGATTLAASLPPLPPPLPGFGRFLIRTPEFCCCSTPGSNPSHLPVLAARQLLGPAVLIHHEILQRGQK